MNILIIDDNQIDRFILRRLLKKEGWDQSVVDAPSVSQAIDCCRRQKFDLVFMDLSMNPIDGFVGTRLLMEFYGAECPRVVAYSAAIAPDQHHKAKAAGMTDILVKPVRREELRGVLES